MTQAALAESDVPPLSPAAITVDHALAEMDERVNWLNRLTPVNIAEVRSGFAASGWRKMPPLAYAEDDVDELEGIRSELFDLPVRDIRSPLVETLLMEKQREVDRQIELVRMRGRRGFVMASIDLFGPVDGLLLDAAERLLQQVPATPEAPRDVNAKEFIAQAEAEMSWYREHCEDFTREVVADETSGTHLYTKNGNLHVACDYDCARGRVDPLIQHEIGTHSVTRHNGINQPLRTLAYGLADYDTLQEGLAVLGEYLAGYLPPARLRTLAARVIAADMAVAREPVEDIFARLREECALDEDRAFETAMRALRGGGLTKDALYLKGLIELLSYLRHDGDFETLFIGKFALKQMPVLQRLLDRGILLPPDLLPRYLQNPKARERLARARQTEITELYQEEPEP